MAESIIYLDCGSGAGGDMLLAALLGLGEPRAWAAALTRALRLPPRTVRMRRRAVRSLSGWQCQVEASAPRVASLDAFGIVLRRSQLSPQVQRSAGRMLRVLARAEHRVHQGTRDAHHVHELGRMDTLVAMAGCAWAMERLQVRRLMVGPIPLGSGWMASEGGVLPNPGPAVLELLRGFPVVVTACRAELVTPTAAAILRVLAVPVSATQQFSYHTVGYGVGTRMIAGMPGVVRMCIGASSHGSTPVRR